MLTKDIDNLRNKKLYLLDMDGTIYLGNTLFKETIPFLKKILDKNGKFVFVTNNSSKSVSDYVKKLNNLGISFASEKNFFTSTDCAIMILEKKYKDKLIYVQGTQSFVDQLKLHFRVTSQFSDEASCILVGYDDELDYKKMETTCKMLTLLDIPYYATNLDWVYPTTWGFVPDCGSMCYSYFKATGRKPIFIGKPEKFIIEKAIEKESYKKEESIVIGDRLYTDIASGNRAKVDTICVLTGESTISDIEKAKKLEKPKYIFNDLSEIPV